MTMVRTRGRRLGLHVSSLIFGLLLPFSSPSAGDKLLLRGSVECIAWLKGREAKSSVVVERYIEGVLNGMALGSGLDFWNWGGVPLSREDVHLWMDKYCRSHPTLRIDFGAGELMNERTAGAWKEFIAKRSKPRTSPINL